MTRIQAVILDLDGLMVDSEPLSYKAWQELLRAYGYSMSEEEYKDLIGVDGNAAVDCVRNSREIPLSNEEIIDLHYKLWMGILEEEALPMAGLVELISEIKERDLKIGIASNSHSEYVQNMLKIIGLDGDLQCVTTEDMVESGKPAPDVYLSTADCLEVEPGVCLAMEDSPVGLQAAVNAGMRCVVVPNRALLGAAFDGAYALFPSLHEVATNLDWLLN